MSHDSEVARSERIGPNGRSIREVRLAEKRVQDLLCKIKRDPMGEGRYVEDLRSDSDEYASAIRELEIPSSPIEGPSYRKVERTGMGCCVALQ